MAERTERTLNEITPWRRRSLTIPPDSWRAWMHLAVWETWIGMMLFGCLAFGISLIVTAPDRIVTFEDVSRCYAPPPIALPCERLIRVGALNAAFSALGGLLSLVAAAWFIWELWSAVAPKPITDDFLKLLNDSFAHDWRDPRTWPWSRMLWAYGFTSVGILLAAGMALLIWTATSFKPPIKVPTVSVETSQEFRANQ
jgi:hypothetical protein